MMIILTSIASLFRGREKWEWAGQEIRVVVDGKRLVTSWAMIRSSLKCLGVCLREPFCPLSINFFE